ncbi:MAG: ABC transporter permease [Chloroflexi bacterium]|nr:ABC transporter permease [Chloroflexota bacterium]
MVTQPRWHKVRADLCGNTTRTLLTLLTIAAGIFAVGVVVTIQAILFPDMDADYQSANPHAAILYIAPFDDGLLSAVQSMPGVEAVEGRSMVAAHILNQAGDRLMIAIYAIPSPNSIKIDRIVPADPRSDMHLADREILIEQSALAALAIKPGDKVSVELPDRRVRELRVAALVHSVTNMSYAFSGEVTAFVNPTTIEWLGGSRLYTQMYMTVAADRYNQQHVSAVADEVRKKVEKAGRDVEYVLVYNPGRHYATDITQAVMLILALLGALAVCLSTFLVVNTIQSLLSQQIHQIGIMKAIGARGYQITGMYFSLVAILGILALIVALPLSTMIGYGVAGALSGFLNFRLGAFRIPLDAVLLQIGVALIAPLAAAAGPVFNGARITVREALGSYGIGWGVARTNLMDRLLVKIRFLSRPLLISLRNVFRRKTRLALTMLTLALGGAIFIAVFNLWAAFGVVLDEMKGYFLSDVNIVLNRPQRIQKLAMVIQGTPGVKELEGWGLSNAQVLSNDRKNAVQIGVTAPPAGSMLIKPSLTSGRWLLPEDKSAVVIGNHLMKERPDLKTGDRMIVKIADSEYTWTIVGTYQMAGSVSPPIVYVNYEYLSRVIDAVDEVSQLRIMTTGHSAAFQSQVAMAVEQRLRQQGIQISQVMTGDEWLAQQETTIDILVYLLLVMALLIALVGGLGLMGMMGINVLERTREIGVMRAIGASDGTIAGMIVAEVVLIGFMSWILGVLCAIPVTTVLNYGVGVAIVSTPLGFTFGLSGLALWLAGVLAISLLASILPVRNALRLTVRDVLAYE